MSVVGTSSQNSRFSPPDVPGLMLWLDAADSRTVTFTGSNVSRWADKSGNDYTMTTAPDGCSLPVQGTAINGLSTVGINTLSCGIKQSRIINGITNFFWVRREVEGNQFYFGADNSYDFHTGNSQEYASLAYSPVGLQDASMTIYLSNSVVRGRMAYTPLVGVGNINLLCVSNITGETKLQGLSYDRGNTFRSQRCDWGEILLYSNALTRTQIDAVEGYLARRWGIPTYLTVAHPYRSGLPVLRDFSPLDVSGCFLWLDAADQSTLTLSGSNVTGWADKSGRGHTISLVSESPAYVSNIQNGNGSVYFLNGLKRLLATTASFSGSSYSIFAVTSLTSNNGTYQRLLHGSLDGNGPVFFGSSNGLAATFVGSPSGSYNDIAANSPQFSLLNTWTVVDITVQTTSLVPAVNGSNQATKVGTTATFSNFYIGAANDGAQFWVGYLGELLIFNSGVSEAQRRQLQGYLGAKWGLRGLMGGTAHPFRYGPAAIVPTSIPGCALWLDAADSASFTLSGSNVTSWLDKSGAGNHTSNLTGTTTLSSNAVVFTGTQALGTNLGYAASLNTHTMFAVFSYSSLVGAFIETNVTAGNSGSGLDVFITGGGQHGLNTWSAAFQLRGTTGLTTGTTYIHSHTYAAGGTAAMFLNGTASASTSTGVPSFTSGGLVSLGNWKNGGSYGDFFSGRIREVVIYSNALTSTQRQQLEGYLAWKWGLSSNLPGVSPNYARLYRALTPVFSPLHTAPCSFWLDGADPSTMTLSGSNVTQWNDKSGSGFNAVVSSNAYATLSTTGLVFSNSFYTTNYSASPANETFFTVFTTPGTLVAASNGLVGTQTGGRTILVPGWGPNSNAFGMNNSGVAGGAGVTGLVTNTRYIGVIQITGTSTTAAINGNSPSAPVTITAFTGGRTTTIGRETSTQYAFNGVIHELLAYTASLTTAQRQQVEGYLAWKWGLQGLLGGSPHPFKYGPWLGTPTAISGCALWLDATDSTTLFQDAAGTSPVTTTGQTLRRWNDKSGRGCNATQPAGNAPTWNSAGYTTFTRTSAQNLRLPDGTLPYSAVNTAYSMFAVVRPTVSSAILTILCSGSQGTNQFNGLQIQSDGRLMNIWFNNDVGGGSVPQNVFSIASAIYTGSSRSVFLTGSTVNTTASSGWAGTISNNVIGMESSTNNHAFGGDIGELIVYPTALSTAERQQIEGYLAWKWGTSATLPGPSYHPYRAIKP